MLDCSYAGVSITSGIKYLANFTPQYPLAVNENTILNLDFSSGGGAQLNDNSSNDNHFSLYGSYQWNSDVPSSQENDQDNDQGNYSLSFDGVDDYVDINVSVSSDFSLMGWFNYETADNGNAIIASSSNDFLTVNPFQILLSRIILIIIFSGDSCS